MFSLFINLIFSILKILSNLLLSPIFSLVGSLIPDFSNFTSSISGFLSSGIQYFAFILKLFMIPQVCITATVSLALTYLTIRISITTYLFLLRCWKTFKP